jgi:site-specific DNA recombinase
MYSDAVTGQRAPEAPRRAGLYARISADRRGDELGVRRQIADCEKLAEARGFTVAERYVDNDVSAFAGRTRPEYERLLADVHDGHINAILSWHPDRIYRHPRDLETFVETVEAAGATVATVQAGELDLSTPSGRMVARMLGATARYEGEHKAERQRRKHRELAEAGKPTGGGNRPFGFEADRVTVREDEAREIRAAVGAIVSGGSLRSVVNDWRARSIRTPYGGAWGKTSIRRMVASPRIAGLRAHRGVVVGPAIWPGIITMEQHVAITSLFSDRSRRGARAPRRYLLTGGVARCARCDAAMVARPNERGDRRYACAKDFGGCDRTFHIAEPLENFVRDAVFFALDGPTLSRMRAEAVADDGDGLAAELSAVEARRAEAVAAFGSGALSLRSFQAADRDLEDRADRLRDRLAARSRNALASSLPPNAEALAEWWEGADLDRRRQLVGLLVERVEIGPAVQGRNRFDASRIDVRWRA